jgi:cardiolipin synthase
MNKLLSWFKSTSLRRAKAVSLPFTFCLFFLASCSSIPIIVPDMSLERAKPIQLDSANGPLSNKRSQEIIARLKKASPDTQIFDRHLAIETELFGNPLIIGNKAELLIDGPTTYQAMFEAIEKAKDHVNLETFIFEDDEDVGKKFAELLIRKQQSGVQVNVIYDSGGSLTTPSAFFQNLKDKGINILEFNPVNPLKARKGWQVNERDHRKLLVVDGEQAFLGGINISSVYSRGSLSGSKPSKDDEDEHGKNLKDIPWRDTHVRITGPSVAEFQKLFIATWLQQKGEPLAIRKYFPELKHTGKEVVRAIGSSPDDKYNQMYVTLLSAFNSAETHLWITNAYFVPDPQMMDALKDAVKRGVDVRLLLPGKSDSDLVWYASRSYYNELLKEGVKIYERNDALLHAKTALIDGVWSTIGSTNMDWRSFVHNYEVNAVILSAEFGDKMRVLYEKDLEAAHEIKYEDWKKRSIYTRMKERAARLWARFL